MGSPNSLYIVTAITGWLLLNTAVYLLTTYYRQISIPPPPESVPSTVKSKKSLLNKLGVKTEGPKKDEKRRKTQIITPSEQLLPQPPRQFSLKPVPSRPELESSLSKPLLKLGDKSLGPKKDEKRLKSITIQSPEQLPSLQPPHQFSLKPILSRHESESSPGKSRKSLLGSLGLKKDKSRSEVIIAPQPVKSQTTKQSRQQPPQPSPQRFGNFRPFSATLQNMGAIIGTVLGIAGGVFLGHLLVSIPVNIGVICAFAIPTDKMC